MSLLDKYITFARTSDDSSFVIFLENLFGSQSPDIKINKKFATITQKIDSGISIPGSHLKDAIYLLEKRGYDFSYLHVDKTLVRLNFESGLV